MLYFLEALPHDPKSDRALDEPRTLQKLMGHASFTTTERYAHVGVDHLRETAKRINL